MLRDKKEALLAKYHNDGRDETYMEALELYEKALTEEPENPKLYQDYGDLNEHKGRLLLRRAANLYEKGVFIALQPGNLDIIENEDCHLKLINVRGALNEHQKSIDLYKDYISKYSDRAVGYYLLTASYLNADQLKEARLAIDAGYKIAPLNSNINFYMGEVYSRLNKIEDALKYYESSIKLDGKNIKARCSRAYLLEGENRLEEAAAEWKFVIQYYLDKGYESETLWPNRNLARIENLIKFSTKPLDRSQIRYPKYFTNKEIFKPIDFTKVRWLDWEKDHPLINDFYKEEYNDEFNEKDWMETKNYGYTYAGIIIDDKLASFGSVLKHDNDTWEVAGIQTKKIYKNEIYQKAVMSFIANHILSEGRMPICHSTEGPISPEAKEYNDIIEKDYIDLGFVFYCYE